jgi:hypothetical protein
MFDLTRNMYTVLTVFKCSCSYFIIKKHQEETLVYLGKLDGFPHFSMQNFLGPLEPLRAENPS